MNILDIIVCNEDDTVLWISEDHASSDEDAYLKFVEYMVETGRDLEYFIVPSKLSYRYGRWENIEDGMQMWVDDEEGDMWYVLSE